MPVGTPQIGSEVGRRMTAKPTVRSCTNSLGKTGSGLMSSIRPTAEINKAPKKNSGHNAIKFRLAAKMIMTRAKPPPFGVGEEWELLELGTSSNFVYLAVLVSKNKIIIQEIKYI
jgi:hypothetical protein